jgi:glutamate-ammonia-ligase adenylyltransferase
MYPNMLPFNVLEGGSEEEIKALLAPVEFAIGAPQPSAIGRMQRPFVHQSFFPHLQVGLANAAGPDRVLINLDRLVARQFDRLAFFRTLAHDPRAVEILVTLFSGSQFLTEILLRNPAYFERLIAYRRMAAPKSADQLYAAAQEMLGTARSPKHGCLRRFKVGNSYVWACDLLNV